jgi:hypothetical protein
MRKQGETKRVLTENLQINFKMKIRNKLWIEAHPYYSYNTRTNSYDLEVNPLIGFQATKQISLKLSAGYKIFRYIWELYKYPESSEEISEEKSFFGRFTSTMTFNCNWSVYAAPNIALNPNWNKLYCGLIFGATFQW